MSPAALALLAGMRAWAGSGEGWICFSVGGWIPIFKDEIDARPDDNELLAYVVERCKGVFHG